MAGLPNVVVVNFQSLSLFGTLDAVGSTGLRERKKERTRRDLTDAATRLFAERGFDAVTIEEIAEAADVSPRTFYRYFAAKEDLVFGDLDETLERVRQAFSERSPDEPVLRSLRALLVQQAVEIDSDPTSTRRRGDLIRTTPSLQLRHHERQRAIEAALTPIVAERMGLPPGDLRPALLVALVFSAFRTAIIAWLTSGAAGQLAGRVEESIRYLTNGFADLA